ncbi:hypothetical protein [Mycobacteroides abscessus]
MGEVWTRLGAIKHILGLSSAAGDRSVFGGPEDLDAETVGALKALGGSDTELARTEGRNKKRRR